MSIQPNPPVPPEGSQHQPLCHCHPSVFMVASTKQAGRWHLPTLPLLHLQLPGISRGPSVLPLVWVSDRSVGHYLTTMTSLHLGQAATYHARSTSHSLFSAQKR